MNTSRLLATALDPSRLLEAQGLRADPWQRTFLENRDRQVLLNCSRQAGKSTAVAALALHTALFTPGSLVVLVSPSQRQSLELFRKIRTGYEALGRPFRAVADAPSSGRLELANGSRVLGLPGREGTIRGLSGVRLLLIDEAARVPDPLYYSVRPMLAVSHGRLVALSTPFGPRGFFWKEWSSSGPWQRFEITYRECPRIGEAFVAEEERAMGRSWVDQEYRCLFTASEGLVYPDFAAALIPTWPGVRGRAVGGLDWGWNNPFAAVWGVLDHDDVLWLGWESYARQQTLDRLIDAVSHQATPETGSPPATEIEWWADPSGPGEIAACRRAGWTVKPGANALRLGIMAVTRRLRTGRLKIVAPACPNLVRESQLYRYPRSDEPGHDGEHPIDRDNHALAALRYLVARLDEAEGPWVL